MTKIMDAFVDRLKKLPGFAYVFLTATLVYGSVRGGAGELLAWEVAAVAVSTWILYRISSVFDGIYDWVYAPHRPVPRRWCRARELSIARDRAARALFKPADSHVTDYASAVARGYVAKPNAAGEKTKVLDPPSLYTRAVATAKRTATWEDAIAPNNDLSKAARALFLLSLVLIGLHVFAPWARTLENRLLSFLSAGMVVLLLVLGCCFFAFVYWSARLRHHLQLYSFVSAKVLHLPLPDGRLAVTAFDVDIATAGDR